MIIISSTQPRGSSPFIARVISALEDTHTPFTYYLFTFLAAVALRNFLEFLIVRPNPPIPIAWHHPVHFSLFYIALALSVVLLICGVTRTRIERVARVVLVLFTIVITPPLIDSALSAIWHYKIVFQYFIPDKTPSLWVNYLFYFGEHEGAPPGVRIEVAIALASAFIYTRYKTQSLLRSLLAVWLLYSLIFFYFSVLYVIESAEKMSGLPLDTSPRMMIDFYLLIAMPLLIASAYLLKPEYVTALVRDIRAERVMHYLMMVVVGAVLGVSQLSGWVLRAPEAVEIILMMIALVAAWLYSAITNNLADVTIDRISNPQRPTVTGTIPEQDYRTIAHLLLAVSVLYSLAAGFMQAFLIICYIGTYFIYSMPPLRLKRVLLLSKGFIAFNCLLMMLAGFVWSGRQLIELPTELLLFIMVFFTAALNFIDIKDYEGDRAAGITTLPTLIGERMSRIIIGLFFLVAYAAFPFIIGPRTLLGWSLAFGAMVFIAMNVGKYRESKVFTVYLSSVVFYLGYLVH